MLKQMLRNGLEKKQKHRKYMENTFKPKVRFTSNEEIYHFNFMGKLEKTTVYIAPICPLCRRSEHAFEFNQKTIWCCSNADCLESRLNNAGLQSYSYPINFIGYLRKRNQFATATLDKDGIIDDFVDKWNLLKKGKIKDIIVQGDLGVGKTSCMYASLHEVCKISPQSSVIFVTETEFYEKIKNTWEKDSKISEQDMMKKLSSVDFLFLDDLGSATKTNQGDWCKQVLLDVLDERLNSLTLRTIISSNFIVENSDNPRFGNSNDFRGTLESYGPRIIDRLRMMTKCFMQGPSRRKPLDPRDNSEDSSKLLN
jgi:DNA replication protein DnaC